MNAEKISRLTFPTSSVGGYKKQDVDDFLSVIARDYKKFEAQIEGFQQKEEQYTKKTSQLKDFYLDRESKYLLEIKQLKEELAQMTEKQSNIEDEQPIEKTTFQKAIMIAQETAFEIEQQAEEEKQRILEQAEFDRGHIIKKARQESNELLEKAKQTKKDWLEEAEMIKKNADHRAETVEKHTQTTLQELSAKKQKEEQQAKSELSKLEYKKQQLQQDISSNRQEEITFLESQIYEYKLLLHRLEKQNWQHLAEKMTQRLQKI